MRKLTQWYRLAAVAAAVGTFGCKSLEVTNPNAPDAARAFSDPAAVAGLVTGAMRNWFDTRGAYYGGMNLVTMADSYTASWNNAQMRYYSSYDPVGNAGADCPQRCGWVNNTSALQRLPLEAFWYGYYGLLSSVNDVLTAIRRTDNPLVLGDQDNTDMHESISVMLQGAVFANIALNYDKGFVVTEATDISNPADLPFRPRAEMRDSAIAKFDQAIALMTAHPFDASPTTWTGSVSGISYSSAEYIKVIRTMQAELLAFFPRNAAENGTVNWGQVATYASQGVSSGTAFDFNFFVDGTNVFDVIKNASVNFMRVDSRLANLVTGGYPDAKGPGPVFAATYTVIEPQPNSKDLRVGNGTWGPEDDVSGAATIAEDAGHGSDYAYSPTEPFRVARGTYHQTSLIHIRYSYLASPGSGLPTENGRGIDALYPVALNDLLWAEGLIRGGGSAATAATLINKTRVGRGGLTPIAAGAGQAALLLALQYEQEVELMGVSASAFYNRRRGTPQGWQLNQTCPAILCLWPDTPRQMPVPAKELSVLQKELYTFGGAGVPDLSPSYTGGEAVFSARQIGEAIKKLGRPGARKSKM